MSTHGRGSGVIAPLASRSYCMNTRFQISSQRSESPAGSKPGRLPALRSHVEVDLGARATRAGVAHRPEVVGLVEPHDPIGRHAHFLGPDPRGLVVLAEHRDAELLGGQPVDVGDELPRPRDRVLLEVVAEREVAEHLEEREVARRAADVLEVVVLARDAHALLRGGRGLVVAHLLAQERALELHHARVGEQQRRVALRDQRRARDAPVSAALEEAQEALADLARGQRHLTSGEEAA